MKNKKSLGQHWLKNRAILDEIASLTKVEGIDKCLEIGPGLGTLTSSLLRQFAEVIAIEYDADLARKLPGSFPGKNLKVVEGDVLAVNFGKITSDKYCIAGNIPYYITSPIVKKVLDLENKPARIVLLMQKEVAERIAAEPGKYNLLALYAQNRAEVTLGPVVKAAEFTPPPKVDSQILILDPLSEPQIDEKYLELAKIGFSSPRKKVAGNLAMVGSRSREDWRRILEENGINPDSRPGDLSLWDWEALAQSAK